MPSGARLRTLAALVVEGLDPGEFVHGEAKSRRRQLVEIATIRFLLFWEHAALSRADPGTRQLGTLGQSNLGFEGQRPKAHIGDNDRNVEVQRFRRTGPNDEVGCDRYIVELRHASQLRGDKLEIVPGRQVLDGNSHSGDGPMMTHLLEAVSSQRSNGFDLCLEGILAVVLEDTLVGIAIVRLWVLLFPGDDLFLVHPDSTILDPGRELLQTLLGVVGADSAVDLIVPGVHPTDQVVPTHEPIGHMHRDGGNARTAPRPARRDARSPDRRSPPGHGLADDPADRPISQSVLSSSCPHFITRLLRDPVRGRIAAPIA